jgi:4-aminobutyrate aminotransferase-like enzyme
MGNGYPVAALVTRREILEEFAFAGRIFSTFGGNPVAAQAALAVLDVIDDERVIPHTKRVGELLRERLEALSGDHPSMTSADAGSCSGSSLKIRNRTNAVMNAMATPVY